jgi:hypothetical protein
MARLKCNKQENETTQRRTLVNRHINGLMLRRIFTFSTCRIPFAKSLTASCLLVVSTHAATITVTNTNDNGAGSLRQAIADAHDADTIQFGVTGTIILTTGELVVDKSVIINGPGSNNLTVSAMNASRVFRVTGGVTVTIAGITAANSGTQDGVGRIYNDRATVVIDKCRGSSGYDRAPGSGGYHDSSSRTATLSVTNSSVSGNHAAAPNGVGNSGSIDPNLAIGNANGEIETVPYHAINVTLLNEFLKEPTALVAEQEKIKNLEAELSGIVATVKEQATQIEKVGAQLHTGRPRMSLARIYP